MAKFSCAHRRRLSWIRQRVHGRRILDVGPVGGGGLYSIHYALRAANPDSQILGVDIIMDHRFIDQTGTPGVRADIKALPFCQNYFDAVLAGEILEHLADPYHAVAEMKRVLSPGGYLYITLPNIHRPASVIRNMLGLNRRENWIKPHWCAWHHYEFSLPQLNTLAHSQGLKIVKVISDPFKFGALTIPAIWPLKQAGVWWLAILQKQPR